jgi:hypothetical protein
MQVAVGPHWAFVVHPTYQPPEQTSPAAQWLLEVQEQPLACLQEQLVPLHFVQTR